MPYTKTGIQAFGIDFFSKINCFDNNAHKVKISILFARASFYPSNFRIDKLNDTLHFES